ncbi:hypothetical protein ACQKGL_13965 [Ensifer adhaerens]|uniref:hypothetical protein n=1 Tax=Ensifer adhaerens TaxID=106592 RepID=UPI003D00939D
MKTAYILIATILTVGLVATIKVPNTRGNERLIASYRADPKTTLGNVEAAIFECVPDSAQSPVASKYVREVITPYFIKIVDLRSQGVSNDGIIAQMEKWIIDEHPELVTDRPDEHFAVVIGVLKKIGEDDVENCILASAASSKVVAVEAEEWDLRI